MKVKDKSIQKLIDSLPMINRIDNATTKQELADIIDIYPDYKKGMYTFNYGIFAYACRQRRIEISKG